MTEKSRVVLYEDLRKKISQMDVYSFEEGKTIAKKLPAHEKKEEDVSLLAPQKSPRDEPVTPTKGIKKNTLSLSIDQLIQAQDSYDSKSQKKETKRRYKESRKSDKKKVNKVNVFIWILIILSILLLLSLVLYVILRK